MHVVLGFKLFDIAAMKPERSSSFVNEQWYWSAISANSNGKPMSPLFLIWYKTGLDIRMLSISRIRLVT